MKSLASTMALAAVLGLLILGCGPSPTPASTSAPPATLAPAASPTPSPTEAPTATVIQEPSRTPPAPESPAEPPAQEVPPEGATLGDTWARPIDGMVMVYVPAGEFEMGSNDPFYNNERPPHTVALEGFWVDQVEVTNAQYRVCVETGACKPPASGGSFSRLDYFGVPEYDDYPVIHVNWYRSVAYCKWAGGRLPTEAEWEYVARGPESRRLPWDGAAGGVRMNYCDASCVLDHADPAADDGYPDTAPVGSYPAGASWCGALDIVGNVWEWVWDWYGFYPSEDNPSWLASDMEDRVIRGGAWDTIGDHARCTFRNWFNPAQAHDSIGFRCVIAGPIE